MTPRRRPVVVLLVLLAIDALAAWAAVTTGFVSTGSAVRVAATLAAAITVLTAFGSIPVTRAPAASPFEQSLRRQPARPVEPPASLERMRRTAVLSVTAAGNLHYRLRPILRDIAIHRLRSNHRVDLDGQPGAARQRLGESAFELVQADRDRPADRLAPGIPTDELAGVVRALEDL